MKNCCCNVFQYPSYKTELKKFLLEKLGMTFLQFKKAYDCYPGQAKKLIPCKLSSLFRDSQEPSNTPDTILDGEAHL